MSSHRLERLNRRSPSPMLASYGHGSVHGHRRGRAALNLEEEVPPTGGQHVEEPILEEPGAAQLGGEGAPPGGDNAPSPPPLLSKVMDRQMLLMETLAKGLLCHNGGPPNDF